MARSMATVFVVVGLVILVGIFVKMFIIGFYPDQQGALVGVTGVGFVFLFLGYVAGKIASR